MNKTGTNHLSKIDNFSEIVVFNNYISTPITYTYSIGMYLKNFISEILSRYPFKTISNFRVILSSQSQTGMFAFVISAIKIIIYALNFLQIFKL